MSALNATIPSHDGKSFGAYLAKAEDPHAPVIIVIQEIFGVYKGLRQLCDMWSKQGFHALCPDLFWRLQPGIELNPDTEMDKAMALMQQFDVNMGVQDLKSAATYARSFESAHVGTMGFCLGGKMAFLMAAEDVTECNVSYYGGGIDQLLTLVPRIKRPLLMHLAEADKHIGPEAREKIIQGVASNKMIEVEVYPGVDHAFARIGGSSFDRNAADLANTRTLEFFKKHLAG